MSPIHFLSDPISFDMCRSGPVLPGTGSVVTTGVGEDGNRKVGDKTV